MSSKLSNAIRKKVAQRAKFCCEYCLALGAYSPDPFCIEHIIPVSKDGSDDLENLAFSCNGCNNYKYTHTHAVDPLSGKLVALYHPRKDSWHAHFMWNRDYITMLGITATGRATIDRLKLNREGLKNQRELLAKAGKHPPF